MNSIECKTGAERLQTARSEQNYGHVTELIYSQEGNTRSSRSPKKRNLTVISFSSDCCEKKHMDTNTSSLIWVKMLLGSFYYIVISLCKISTPLSGFGSILCRKKQRLKFYIACTDKRVQVQYKWHNLNGRFFYCPLCIYLYWSKLCPKHYLFHFFRTHSVVVHGLDYTCGCYVLKLFDVYVTEGFLYNFSLMYSDVTYQLK